LSGQATELGLLVDTDVLIWHLRGYPSATRRLDDLGTLTLSAVSYLEVLQGMRSQAELLAVQKMVAKRSATLLPITETITQRAIGLMEAITLSHGLQMGDALIAATALEHHTPVLTGNVKHFVAVPGIKVEAFLR
jgi:predicted nucleic acid-binding protein